MVLTAPVSNNEETLDTAVSVFAFTSLTRPLASIITVSETVPDMRCTRNRRVEWLFDMLRTQRLSSLPKANLREANEEKSNLESFHLDPCIPSFSLYPISRITGYGVRVCYEGPPPEAGTIGGRSPG